MQCLNLNNKEVKAAVDEVAKVLGSEDAAYYIISENNGYAIDQGPDGSQSELFSDLLRRFDGDRNQAIRQIAKTFIPAQGRPSYFFSNIGDITGTWSDGSPHMSTTSGQVVERLKQYIPKDSIAYQILDLFSNTDVYIGITEEKINQLMGITCGIVIILILYGLIKRYLKKQIWSTMQEVLYTKWFMHLLQDLLKMLKIVQVLIQK